MPSPEPKLFSEEWWAARNDEGRCPCRSNAESNRAGEDRRCLRPIVGRDVGGTVCTAHGAKTKAYRNSVERKRADVAVERAVSKALAKRPVEPVGDMITTYERLIAETVTRCELFLAMLDELIDNDNLTVVTVSQGEQLRAIALAAERWLKEARAAVADWMRLNLDERRVKVDEAQARITLQAIGKAFNAILDDDSLLLSVAQKERIKQLIAARLS